MIRKSISITKNQEQWLKKKVEETELSESDILRRILDEKINNENK